MRFRKEGKFDWMRLDSALKKVVPYISRPKKSRHFLMHWMSVKLPDNFQMCEHSWPCRFHIIILWCIWVKSHAVNTQLICKTACFNLVEIDFRSNFLFETWLLKNMMPTSGSHDTTEYRLKAVNSSRDIININICTKLL